MSELSFEVVHEDGLSVAVCTSVYIEYKDVIRFDECPDVQEIDQYGVLADQNMGDYDARVELAKIPGKKPMLEN